MSQKRVFSTGDLEFGFVQTVNTSVVHLGMDLFWFSQKPCSA